MLHMMRLLTLRNAAYPAYGPLILRKFYGSILQQYITIILLLPLPIELAKLWSERKTESKVKFH